MLIKRVRAGTECATGEEQCGFRLGRGCMNEMFAVRLVCEKYIANGKDVFLRLWIWKRHMIRSIGMVCMWQMLRVYRVGGKFLKAVQSFYIDRRACVRVRNDVSEWFPVNVGLRQAGCLMYIWMV